MARIVTLIFVLVACFPGTGAAIEVSNFKSGLVCEVDVETPDADVPIMWICFETETVYITGQGECIYARKEERCTWYGYEFEYSGAEDGDSIDCISSSTEPTNVGNPEEMTDEAATTSEWSIAVGPGRGRHFNPQYTVSTFAHDQDMPIHNETVCFVDGEEVFRFRFTIIIPGVTEREFRNALFRAVPELEGSVPQ